MTTSGSLAALSLDLCATAPSLAHTSGPARVPLVLMARCSTMDFPPLSMTSVANTTKAEAQACRHEAPVFRPIAPHPNSVACYTSLPESQLLAREEEHQTLPKSSFECDQCAAVFDKKGLLKYALRCCKHSATNQGKANTKKPMKNRTNVACARKASRFVPTCEGTSCIPIFARKR